MSDFIASLVIAILYLLPVITSAVLLSILGWGAWSVLLMFPLVASQRLLTIWLIGRKGEINGNKTET